MVKDSIKVSSGGQGRNKEGKEGREAGRQGGRKGGRKGKLVYLREGGTWRTR